MQNEQTEHRQYPGLERLEIKSLEHLLRQDLITSDAQEPDVDYIMAIMEVIQAKYQAAGYQPLDIDAAWKSFQENYQNQTPLVQSNPPCCGPDPNPSSINQPGKSSHTSQPKSGKTTRLFRYFAAAAVFTVILGSTTASAFGFNVFQVIASWTAETFGFDLPGAQTAAADPYKELRHKVSNLTDTPVVPNWSPEGTTLLDVTFKETLMGTRVQASFSTEDKDFNITIFIYHTILEIYNPIYQKDNTNIIEYQVNNITHYMINNNEFSGATWSNQNVECTIQGNLSLEDLERMVNSIYEE